MFNLEECNKAIEQLIINSTMLSFNITNALKF